MEQGLALPDEGLDEPIGVLDAQTPYELTLKGLQYPWPAAFGFNALAGLAMALLGGVWLALAWTLLSSLADYGLQRLYGRWAVTAPQADSARGLRRLTACVAFRSSLWMAAPTCVALTTQGVGAHLYSALTALSMVALAVSTGWISRGVWAGFATPAALGLVIQAAPYLRPLEGAATALGLVSFAATALVIAIATERSLSDWSGANERTRSVLKQLKVMLFRSQADEHCLRLAAEISRTQIMQVDFRKGTVVMRGLEAGIYPEPPSFPQMSADPFFIVAPEHRAKVEAAWADYLAGRAPYHVEFRVNREDREVWASAKGELALDDEGRPTTLVCVLRDVTELIRSRRELIAGREKAEAGNRAKSDFLATMSHEIRTPLNGVLGMAQAMARDELPSVQRSRLEVIRKSGEALLALLNNILDLSKIEAGRLELEAGELHIEALARSVLAAFSGQVADKDVSLALAVEPQAAGLYAGDAARVGQILYNLVGNAVKFTPAGSVDLRVRRSASGLVLEVADTGIGIAPDQQERLFDKFVQADASTTREYGGSGLGLAICRQLAELMGGEVAFSSKPGFGSTFTVTLPLRRIGEASRPPVGETPAAPDDAAAQSSLQVLAAEDNPVNQVVLYTLLQQVGIEPTIVSDGCAAVKAFAQADWDLVLMDVQMPVMDGLGATRAIRKLEMEQGRSRTPIVALTANVMVHQVEEYRAAGMDRVVAKPIDAAALFHALFAWEEPADAAPDAARERGAAA